MHKALFSQGAMVISPHFAWKKEGVRVLHKKGSGEGQQHHPKLNVWKRSEIWEEEMSL